MFKWLNKNPRDAAISGYRKLLDEQLVGLKHQRDTDLSILLGAVTDIRRAITSPDVASGAICHEVFTSRAPSIENAEAVRVLLMERARAYLAAGRRGEFVATTVLAFTLIAVIYPENRKQVIAMWDELKRGMKSGNIVLKANRDLSQLLKWPDEATFEREFHWLPPFLVL